MNENITYDEYLEQREKSSNIASRLQSKHIIWLVILFVIGNALIAFGLGGDKRNYYYAFNGFMVLVFIIMSQTGDSKPIPRSLKEAIEIAMGEGKTLIEMGFLNKPDLKVGELLPTGKAAKSPKENPNVWRIGMAIIDKESKLPFYHVFEVDFYKGPVGISNIGELPKGIPYNGEEQEIKWIPISSEKIQAFKKAEMFEGK